jgi:hypothetical protein
VSLGERPLGKVLPCVAIWRGCKSALCSETQALPAQAPAERAITSAGLRPVVGSSWGRSIRRRRLELRDRTSRSGSAVMKTECQYVPSRADNIGTLLSSTAQIFCCCSSPSPADCGRKPVSFIPAATSKTLPKSFQEQRDGGPSS